MAEHSSAAAQDLRLNSNFRKLWIGQAISALGNSFTGFALPLLVYNLTGSALNLAYATAATFMPYLLFGLVIGAWTDRTDRQRLMIWMDVGRALSVGSIPLLASMDLLFVQWIYLVLFINSTMTIVFDAAKFAAVPSLVEKDLLVLANGRIQASYSTMTILGPLLAGLLIAVVPIYELIVVDALSFLSSAVCLVLITKAFHAAGKPKTSIKQDIAEGLRYVMGHPVLRNISIMMAIVNLVTTTIFAQRVLYAREHLGASDPQIAVMSAASSFGVVVLSLLAARLRKRLPFSRVALGALMLQGVCVAIMALTHSYWVALVLWALVVGLGNLFNINTGSLRQAIAPSHMLGRVLTIAGVLAWSANPVGAFLGALIIEQTNHNLLLVYGAIGVCTIIIPALFALGPLGHAERYLSSDDEPGARSSADTEHPSTDQHDGSKVRTRDSFDGRVGAS